MNILKTAKEREREREREIWNETLITDMQTEVKFQFFRSDYMYIVANSSTVDLVDFIYLSTKKNSPIVNVKKIY